MSTAVFFLTPEGEPMVADFADHEFGLAMKKMEELRRAGARHVCMSTEPAGMVGKPGVDSIKDGKTPDGQVYDWSKAGRAGKMRRGDELKPARDGKTL